MTAPSRLAAKSHLKKCVKENQGQFKRFKVAQFKAGLRFTDGCFSPRPAGFSTDPS